MSFFDNPKGYPLVPLINVATLKRGYDLPVDARADGDIPIYAANGRNGTHNEYKIKAPGVVTGRSGTIGKVHFVEENFWPLNTSLYVTNFHGNDPKWVYYMLSAFKLERFVEGAGVPTLNRNLFHQELIPLPPLEEQKRIAAILDKADAIRRKRQQAIKLADDFLRSVFLEMFGDPVTNPKGWEVKTLGEFCSFQGGFAFKSVDYTDYGVPLLKITNVHFEDVDWDDVSYLPEKMLLEKSDFSLEVGDLVMAMTRPIIKSLEAVKVVEIKNNDIPSLLNQRVGRFKGYDRVAAKEFFKYFLYSEYFRSEVEKLCSVALQPNVSSKQIESILCYLPPRNVQDEFSRIVSCVNKMLPKLKVASQENLFEALSQKAFSGQL